MTELQRRVPGATIGTASCAPMERRRFLAELKRQQQAGEIGAVWTTDETVAEGIATGRFVVAYTRITEPRTRVPLYATLTAVALGAVVSAGVLAWHSRHVILAAALAVLALWYLATRNRGCKCVIIHICGGH